MQQVVIGSGTGVTSNTKDMIHVKEFAILWKMWK